MRVVLALLAILTTALPARAGGELVELRVRSLGRPVIVELLDERARQTCTTPCVLRVAPGTHRARVDGLDRTLVPDDGEVVIAPTRRGRLYAGLGLTSLGALGLVFASHWASPLAGRDRLASGLGGGALLALAIPVIVSSSARIGRAHTPSRADLYAGVQHGEAGTVAAIGAGFAPGPLGVDLRARFSDDAAIYQLAGGVTLHGPRLPLVQPMIAARLGLASQRGPETPPDLAMERPAIPGELERRLLVEVEGRLELAPPGRLRPTLGLTAQALPARRYGVDVGLLVLF